MTSDLLLLTHYPPAEGRSMAAYRQLLEEGLGALGYRVRRRTATVRFGGWAAPGSSAAKWLGYVDQFVVFPLELLWERRRWPDDLRVAVSDQALGPWVPWIRRFPHLVICHDLLALRASRGEFPQQPVGWSGRLYQQLIRWGFRQGCRFAAVSDASRVDLARELPSGHAPIAVIHNPLQQGYGPMSVAEAKPRLKTLVPGLGGDPFLLHVGTNWYKNRLGLCQVFEQLHPSHPRLQLVLVGRAERALQQWLDTHPQVAGRVSVLHGVMPHDLRALYSRAAMLLFPSFLEGFGWPVLEALACGCPVVTTARAPLTEVGGQAATYVPAAPADLEGMKSWSQDVALQVATVLARSDEERQVWRRRALEQAARFSREAWLERLEALLTPEGGQAVAGRRPGRRCRPARH